MTLSIKVKFVNLSIKHEFLKFPQHILVCKQGTKVSFQPDEELYTIGIKRMSWETFGGLCDPSVRSRVDLLVLMLV